MTPGYLSFAASRPAHIDSNVGRNLTAMDAPGVLLTDMVGRDFRISARFDDVNVPDPSDQLLLYVGTSDQAFIRGGFHSNEVRDPSHGTGQFVLVGNLGNNDFGFLDPWTPATFATGDDVILSLSRASGVWKFDWENLSNPAASGGYPEFQAPWLDAAAQLYVGLTHLDFVSGTQQTAKVDYFQVAAVPESSPAALAAVIGLGCAAYRTKKLWL